MLIKDTATLLKYTGVITAVKFNEMELTLDFVEKKQLLPILGWDQYKELDNYTGDEPNAAELAELIEYCRKVIGPYACAAYAPKVAVQLSSAGMQRTESENSKSAFAYQEKNFIAQQIAEGDAAIETLVQYLFKYKASFNSWTDSPEFKEMSKLFIKSGAEFDRLYKTNQPWRFYWAIRFKMVEVESLSIKKAITKPLFDSLKTKVAEDAELTENEDELILMLKRAIVYQTLAAAIPHLNIRFDDNGITIVSDFGSIQGKESIKAADDNRVSKLIESCQDAAQMWLTQAVEFIAANAQSFEAWTAPTQSSSNKTGNEPNSGVYAMI